MTMGTMNRSSVIAGWAALLASILAACGTRPWVKYPSSTPPDQSCQIGVEAGDDVYVWNCLNGRHTVIVQFVSAFGGSDPVREVVDCGRRTPYEEAHMGPGFVCRPAMKWETVQATQ
jgi:hypothetical protein